MGGSLQTNDEAKSCTTYSDWTGLSLSGCTRSSVSKRCIDLQKADEPMRDTHMLENRTRPTPSSRSSKPPKQLRLNRNCMQRLRTLHCPMSDFFLIPRSLSIGAHLHASQMERLRFVTRCVYHVIDQRLRYASLVSKIMKARLFAACTPRNHNQRESPKVKINTMTEALLCCPSLPERKSSVVASS